MKKVAFSVVLLSAFIAGACSSNGDSKSANEAPAEQNAVANTLNIRYIDADSLTTHYNLAKDFKEISIRTISKLENAQQTRQAEIQRFGAQVEEKMRSNGYLSEASYNADVEKLRKMQVDAQNYLANLQRTAEQEMMEQQQQLNDSIESFIKAYNAEKGYDAILYKAAGVYFNPALDITAEIIEGLNARYNKVAQK